MINIYVLLDSDSQITLNRKALSNQLELEDTKTNYQMFNLHYDL